MTPSQKRLRELRDRQSKERGRMAEFAQVDELTDEMRGELDTIEKGTPDLERQIRAAGIALEDEEREQETKETVTPDAEMRERIELRSKATLTGFFRAIANGRQPSGAESELCAAAGVEGIPLELWDVPPVEHRADAATAAPGTVGVNLDPIRPMVFANALLPRLGVEMPRVESGTYATATITTALTAGPKAPGAAQEATAAAFTVSTTRNRRISIRLGIRIEDVAAVGQPNFEASLRENMALRLSAELDDQGLNGDRPANPTGDEVAQLNGLFKALTDPSDPTAIADFDAFAAAHAGGIDGLWALTLKDVAIVCGSDTMELSARTFQSATNYKGEMSAAAYAEKNTGGWWTSDRMPDAASTIQQAILYRKGRSMMGAAGAMRTAVCPHWNQISIDDIYSGSAAGERYFTAHVLLGDVILVQPDAYAQRAFKVA